MKTELTMSVTKIYAFLHGFEDHGFRKEDVLKAARIDPGVLQSPDHRLRSGEIKRIMREAVRLTNNENIGLRQGERLAKGFSSILGYILMNCDTLGEAAEKFKTYERIVDETSAAQIGRKGGLAVFGYKAIDAALAECRPFSDFKISGMLSYIRLLTGTTIALKEVYFSHRKPQDTSEYRRIFQCPVFFGKSASALVFEHRLMDLPIVEPNKELLPLFEKKAHETLVGPQRDETWAGKVNRLILEETAGGVPSIDAVAKKLAVSVRSLQIYLKREGGSYTKLAAAVRKDTAIRCLKDKEASIGEIAYILGFSEVSAFHRAFKKWTNATPREFRNGKKITSSSSPRTPS